MSLPSDYAERVYAGVLGKIIGVYLGRPFEGWTYDRIMRELGEVNYYVHEKRGVPLIVTDDDISGTFTFLRALPDYGNSHDITPEQIGQTWLNYLIEKRTVLWWGGMGNSTEHTAYLRLKSGIKAPQSGSIATNGRVVAEQIGAQIFIDGWGMVSPGDPAQAAAFARRAASVSHDGEAIYGAQVVAAIEAQAFVEEDINRLLDIAVSFIPKDSILYRMIADLREWHAAEPDWRKTREQIQAHYGYDRYGGNCHMVPNHALIIHALLHGDGDFQKSLMIVNTCGWDTDCNSGNVGCILGIRNGVDGIEDGPDWRGPIADRMFLPTADGGRCITDAAQEAVRIINVGCALAGEEPVDTKDGARYHFTLPDSVQGFVAEECPESNGTLEVYNWDERLALSYYGIAPGRIARAATATFILPEALKMGGYNLMASPTLYSGQTVRASLSVFEEDISEEVKERPVYAGLYLSVYDKEDHLRRISGPKVLVDIEEGTQELEWKIPDTEGYPIAEIGIEISSEARTDGTVYLDYLTWDGTPDVTFKRTEGGSMWRRAWVSGMDYVEGGSETFRLIQNDGVGLLLTGCREWTDYRLNTTMTPHLAESCGIAVRVQGMKRYYALLLGRDGKARLVKALDGDTTLAETDLGMEFGRPYELAMEAEGNRIRGYVDGALLFEVEDTNRPLTEGTIALLCEEGRIATGDVRLQPRA
ncbi:MAG TPA: ADP-ribosylglycohydrolase family protein [Chthonomonadaceae bacterium]|nr:ADP-ribosylglycohydrolase family protein [Chthonomonadaceae bacterium]